MRRHRTQQTMLLSLLVLLGVTALFRALRDAEPAPLVGDRRFRILGVIAIPTYLLAMYVGPVAEFFVLKPLDVLQWAVVVACAVAGYAFSVWTDHWRVGFLAEPEERPEDRAEMEAQIEAPAASEAEPEQKRRRRWPFGKGGSP